MTLPLISIITCTSDRPEAMRMCWGMNLRFASTHRHEWIIADDGGQQIAEDIADSADVYLRRSPGAAPTDSFRKNLVSCLKQISSDSEYVIFQEDDDWYSAYWPLECVTKMRDGNLGLYGETAAKYYHVRSRRYFQFAKSGHASLAQTAMKSEHIPWLIKRIKEHKGRFHVDFDLWRNLKCKKQLSDKSKFVISMKGLPGRRNLGVGATMDKRGAVDRDGSVLRKWVGADASEYENFAVSHQAD